MRCRGAVGDRRHFKATFTTCHSDPKINKPSQSVSRRQMSTNKSRYTVPSSPGPARGIATCLRRRNSLFCPSEENSYVFFKGFRIKTPPMKKASFRRIFHLLRLAALHERPARDWAGGPSRRIHAVIIEHPLGCYIECRFCRFRSARRLRSRGRGAVGNDPRKA